MYKKKKGKNKKRGKRKKGREKERRKEGKVARKRSNAYISMILLKGFVNIGV